MAQYKAFLWDMGAYEKAPHPTLHDPIAKSRDHLMRSRTLWKTIPSIDFRGPRVRTPEEIELLGKPGGEHYVELTPDRKHVLKHTKGGRFGKRLLLSPDGKSIVSD